jgi:rRNA maturation protein Rpf1
MGLSQLAARVGQSGAKAALIVSMWKGNPGILSFMSSSGEEFVTVKVESAKLRREVNPIKKNRIIGTAGVLIGSESSGKARELGDILASFLDVKIFEVATPEDVQVDDNWSLIWLEDQPSGKILWTHYHSTNRIEIGPRIRVSSIRRNE